jgi:hypothetical protein
MLSVLLHKPLVRTTTKRREATAAVRATGIQSRERDVQRRSFTSSFGIEAEAKGLSVRARRSL